MKDLYWKPTNEKGKQEKAHAFMWRQENNMSAMPEGHVLHHTCHNTYCLNTDHLILMTRSEHLSLHMKGNSYAAINNRSHSIKVAQIHTEHGLLKVWPSAAEAGRNGFISGNVTRACNTKYDLHFKCWWMKVR